MQPVVLTEIEWQALERLMDGKAILFAKFDPTPEQMALPRLKELGIVKSVKVQFSHTRSQAKLTPEGKAFCKSFSK